MKTKTTKQEALNEAAINNKADRTPAELQGANIVRAKLRCDLLADPGDKSGFLTRDNTRDAMQDHFEEAAAAILTHWQGRNHETRDRFKEWIEAGGTCPIDLLNHALLAVREYPGALGEIGLHYPALRTRATVEDAAARITSATHEADFTRQCETGMSRPLPIVKAWKVIEAGLQTGGAILSRAAADVVDVSPASIECGLTALRSAYEPNPTGYGTASGVAYPDVNSPLWPECMDPRDWDKLREPGKSDLLRLRDSLVALNHSAGKTAGKVAKTAKTKDRPARAEIATPSDQLEAEILRILNRDMNNTRKAPTAAQFYQEHVINARSIAGLERAKGWKARTMKKRKQDIQDHLATALKMTVDLNTLRKCPRKSGRLVRLDPHILERTQADE